VRGLPLIVLPRLPVVAHGRSCLTDAASRVAPPFASQVAPA
jgi:hypothetical protein